ncbi:MAG: hypothetical protein KC593_24355 [Myxococcales bacterium]|nr:hypothetical protein [Myxococcales bacterium]
MASLAILDEAAEEVVAAAEYIEEEREGYGRLFLNEYGDKLTQVARFPQSGARLQRRVAGLELRAFSLKRFPYTVVVAVQEGRSVIIAVAHMSREPGYWRDRLDETSS